MAVSAIIHVVAYLGNIYPVAGVREYASAVYPGISEYNSLVLIEQC